VETPSAASRTISMRSTSVRRFERDMRRKTPYFLPPSTKAAPTLRYYIKLSNIYLRRIQSQAALVSASPAARRDAALPPSPPGDTCPRGPVHQPRPRVWPNAKCSDGTAGGRKPHRQGRQAGSRRARFGSPNLCRKNREALADRFLWMAPLRLTGRSVAA
jgi:hypothetical protein